MSVTCDWCCGSTSRTTTTCDRTRRSNCGLRMTGGHGHRPGARAKSWVGRSWAGCITSTSVSPRVIRADDIFWWHRRAVRLLRLRDAAPRGRRRLRARYLNAERTEGFVVEKIRERILTEETITELVTLVAEEIDELAGELGGKLQAVDAELADVRGRLTKLYEALEQSDVTYEAVGRQNMRPTDTHDASLLAPAC